LEGKIISTPTGFIYGDKEHEAAYKKTNILYFRNKFEDNSLTVDDIEFKSKAMDLEGNMSFENEIINRSPSTEKENDQD